MRLESAMRASREGLVASGTAISVLGDNISNANTTAFKEQRTEFVSLLGERADERNSSLPAGAGDGVAVGRIRQNFRVGATEQTGRELDVALTGGGFFLVGDPNRPLLTRAGNFQLNTEGVLTTADGLPVLGYAGADAEVLGTLNLGDLNINPQATTQIALFGNLDSAARLTPPPANVATFNELSASAAFVSTQSAYDGTGTRRDIQLYYYKTAPNSWTVRAYANGADVGQAADQPVLLGQVDLVFNNFGQIPNAQQGQAAINLNPAWAGVAGQNPFTIPLGRLTQYAGGSRIVNVQADGRGAGKIVGFEIDPDGKIYGATANGERIQAGTLALGSVTNNDGLMREANARYSVTEESGELRVGQAKVGNIGGVMGQALELSNVDLPQQFVDMIVYQRGYQANSQVLSAASDLLKNTISMIR